MTQHNAPFQAETGKVGTSLQGRPILWTRFGDADGALDTLFIGVFHGDEAISGELLTAFQETLLIGSKLSTHLPERFAILPVLNPDGLAALTRTNAAGVDLNRNYPTQDWRRAEEETPYFSGCDAASEPETQCLIRLLERWAPAKVITVHAPYKVINFDGPARPLAEAMAVKNGYPVVASIGYPTPGSFGTYLGVEQNIPVVTLELPEDEPLEQIWEPNRQALLEALAFSGKT